MYFDSVVRLILWNLGELKNDIKLTFGDLSWFCRLVVHNFQSHIPDKPDMIPSLCHTRLLQGPCAHRHNNSGILTEQ